MFQYSSAPAHVVASPCCWPPMQGITCVQNRGIILNVRQKLGNNVAQIFLLYQWVMVSNLIMMGLWTAGSSHPTLLSVSPLLRAVVIIPFMAALHGDDDMLGDAPSGNLTVSALLVPGAIADSCAHRGTTPTCLTPTALTSVGTAHGWVCSPRCLIQARLMPTCGHSSSATAAAQSHAATILVVAHQWKRAAGGRW